MVVHAPAWVLDGSLHLPAWPLVTRGVSVGCPWQGRVLADDYLALSRVHAIVGLLLGALRLGMGADPAPK